MVVSLREKDRPMLSAGHCAGRTGTRFRARKKGHTPSVCQVRASAKTLAASSLSEHPGMSPVCIKLTGNGEQDSSPRSANFAATAALAAALIIGTASLGAASALASDNSGEYSGGFVVPGSSTVNPAYHPRWFPNARGSDAFGYVAPRTNMLRSAPAVHEDNYGPEAGKE